MGRGLSSHPEALRPPAPQDWGPCWSPCHAPGPSSSEDLLLPPCSRSERQLLLYSAEALASGPLAVLGLDVAPSTLLPSYDPDTRLVLLTGKVGWGAQAGALGR